MKTLQLLVALVLTCFISHAQIDERIVDIYGNEKANEILTQQPELIGYLNFYVENGFKILTDVPTDKLQSVKPIEQLHPDLASATISELQSDFNILKYPSPREEEHAAIYRINNTDAVLILTPKNEVMALYKSQKGGKL